MTATQTVVPSARTIPLLDSAFGVHALDLLLLAIQRRLEVVRMGEIGDVELEQLFLAVADELGTARG